MKKLLSVVASIALLLLGMPLGGMVLAATEHQSGYYTYTVSKQKAYITACDTAISGDIVIPDTLGGYPVVDVSKYSFYQCTGLTSIVVPDGVEGVGSYAFYGCTALTSVTLPDSVKTIGTSTFYNCSALSSISFGRGIQSIEDNSFVNCKALKTVNLSDPAAWGTVYFAQKNSSPFYYGATPYHNGQPITSLVIPEGITEIKRFGFLNFCHLTEVTIPKSVTSIGTDAFRDCGALTTVNISDTSSWSSIDFGNIYATPLLYGKPYIDGKPVTELTLPEGITAIKPFSFLGFSDLTELVIPEEVTTIGSYAFRKCSGVKNLVLPDSLTTIEKYAFYACHGLTEVTIPQQVTLIEANTFGSCKKLKTITVNAVACSMEGAFAGCSSLSVSFGDTVQAIPKRAFYKSTELVAVSLSDGITTIGESAFFGCTGLTELTIPKSVTSIGMYAFESCTNLSALYYNAATCSTANAFKKCAALKTVILGDSVQIIPAYLLYSCTGLTEITIPAGVVRIGKDAFFGCKNLTTVNISDTASWSNITFGNVYATPLYYGTPYINGEPVTEPTFDTDITTIHPWAFYGFTDLTSVAIPEGVVSIGEAAFSGCTNLETVTIPTSVTDIYNNAFSDCTKLTTVYYNAKDATISENQFFSPIFKGCPSLKTVVLGNTVQVVPSRLFCDCTELTNLYLPSSVTTIERAAFKGCSSLASIYFSGREAPWNIVVIEEDNQPLYDATVYNYQDICTHNWQAATCDTPKTCTLCGQIDGYTLGHVWVPATCTQPTLCLFCDFIRGEALGHSYSDGICTRCGEGQIAVDTTAQLVISGAIGQAGSTVELTFIIENAPAMKSLAFTDFTYDSDKLEIVSGEWSDKLGGILAGWDGENQNAVITFADNTDLNTAVFTLTLRIKEGVDFGELSVNCQVVAKAIADGVETSLILPVVAGTLRVGVPGDMDKNQTLDSNDAMYLLYYTLLPQQYPLTCSGDMDGNGRVDSNDAIYLLYHTLLPDEYPL